MENIQFASKEHKAFYCGMLIKTRNDDAYHRAFSMRWEFARKQDAISAPSLTSKMVGLTRMAFCPHGRRVVRAVCADWHLIYGTALRRKVKKTVLHPMSCLTVALHRTFLKSSGCVIPNIARALSVSHPGFPPNHGNNQRILEGGEHIEGNQN